MRCATYVLLHLVAVATWTSAAPIPKELKRPNDRERILGKWTQVSLITPGRDVAGAGTGQEFYFRADGQCGIGGSPAEYTLDPYASPKRMKWLNGPEKTEWTCLYELEGDALKVCFINRGEPIPAKLEPGKSTTIYTLTRSKE